MKLVVREMGLVKFGLTDIRYLIRRSPRRNTVSIAMDPHEGVIVTAPERAEAERLDKIVSAKARWITKRLGRMSERPPAPSEREFLSGESYRYLGRQYRLKVRAGDAPLRLHGAYLELGVPKSCQGIHRAARVRSALVDWYRARAQQYLPTRVRPWAARLGLDPPKLVIAEPRKRWGSSSRRIVRINWRIIQAPAALVDYVLVHELVHLIHEDHSKKFWTTVGRAMPDYEQRKKRLREIGAALVW